MSILQILAKIGPNGKANPLPFGPILTQISTFSYSLRIYPWITLNLSLGFKGCLERFSVEISILQILDKIAPNGKAIPLPFGPIFPKISTSSYSLRIDPWTTLNLSLGFKGCLERFSVEISILQILDKIAPNGKANPLPFGPIFAKISTVSCGLQIDPGTIYSPSTDS